MLPANGRGASDSGPRPAQSTELGAFHVGLGPVLAARRATTTVIKFPMLET